MEMRQRDEVKRSKACVAVMLTSTVIILLVIAFFVRQSVVSNPLEGEWVSEEKGYQLDIDNDEVEVEALIDGELVDVHFYYTLDKTNRIITLKPHLTSYAEAAVDSEGKLTANEIDEAMSELVASYYYSIEGGKLTLTECEFAEQFVFTRIEK